MTYEEAVRFCEEMECEDCPAYHNDRRTETEKFETPCCENLVTERIE